MEMLLNLPALPGHELTTTPSIPVPSIIAAAGEDAAHHFIAFFISEIENPNTRAAYARQVQSFCTWCEGIGIDDVRQVREMHVAAYREMRSRQGQRPSSVKQALASIRMLFDWLVVRQVMKSNPATPVRGPKLVVTEGLTPCYTDDEIVAFFTSIPNDTLVGLRDRALIAVMAYTFARVSSVVALDLPHYYPQGKDWMLRFHGKGGRIKDIIVHSELGRHLDDYLEAADLTEGAIFRTAYKRSGRLTDNRMTRNDAYRMLRRRASGAGISTKATAHGIRATGLTNFLKHGGSLEDGQYLAGHADPRTTKLYDRRKQLVSRNTIEKVRYGGEL